MSGTGITTVAAQGTFTIGGALPGNLNLNGRPLTIDAAGSFVVTPARQLVASNGAAITNNGTFELRGDSTAISSGGGGASSFVNTGTFLKTQSLFADQAQVSITFTNVGPLEVQTGILNFAAAFTQLNLGIVRPLAMAGEVRGGDMTFVGGTLEGGGILRVTNAGPGLLTWMSAQMNGSGSVIVSLFATMVMDGTFTNSGFTIANSGTLQWLSGNVTLNNGARINNSNEFEARAHTVMNSTAGTGTVDNYATFRKVQGAAGFGSTDFQVTFNSYSIVDVQVGSVRFQRSGTFGGSVSAGLGAQAEFGNLAQVYTIQDGTTFSGAGIVRITTLGNMLLTGTVTSTGNFEVGGSNLLLPSPFPVGTLSGNGNGVFKNTGTFNWRRGNLTNLAELLNQSQLNIFSDDGMVRQRLDSTVLNNQGTVIWTGAGIGILAVSAANPAHKSRVLNSGTFDIRTDAALANDDVNPGLDFVNSAQATLVKSAGGGTTTIALPFVTSGGVNLQGRNISFAGSVTQDGGSTLIANGLLSTSSYVLNSGTLDLGTSGAGGLTATSGLTIADGAVFSGIGTITGNVNNSGVIDIGAGGAPVGLLTITGDYTQTGTGWLKLRLLQAQNQQYDRVSISGTANLAGTLWVTGLPGFNPAAGDQFTILTYGQHAGDFEQPYSLPALTPPRSWAPAAPGATSLVLTVQ